MHLEAEKLDSAQFEYGFWYLGVERLDSAQSGCGILHFRQEKPNSAFHASEAFVFWGIAVSFCIRQRDPLSLEQIQRIQENNQEIYQENREM